MLTFEKLKPFGTLIVLWWKYIFFYSIYYFMNIFVAKLNFKTSESELKSHFEQYGTVSSVKIIIDYETGKSKGFGFVEMDNDDEARTAIQNINETEFDGRTIVVKEARPRS